MNNLGVAQGSIKINTSDLKNADLALRSAGGSMVNFGMQAVGAFAAIVGEAAKFEKEMDFVQAVTNSSAGEMEALKNKAIELGKESIFGPVALSQAFVDLAKAGASVEDIIGGVGEASVQLATAADVEIPFAGENLINILNTFKLGAEDATYVADQLAGAANASSVDLADMVTTMRYAGPVAQAMGVSFEEVNQALSVLGRVGIKGSTAGTSLRFMMTRLVPDTDKAKDAIRGLGLNIDEATGSVVEFSNTDGSLKDLADIMQVLQDKTKGLTDQQKIAVVNDIFGVRAMPSVLELMNAGKDGFAELTAEIERTTAADVAAKRMDNLDGSIKRLKATLSAIMIDAGGPFQTMVKDWVDGLRDLLIAFDNLPEPIKNLLVGSLLAVGVLSLLAGGFLLTIGNMVRAVRVIYEIANAFGVLAGGMGRVITMNGALTVSLLASPWFWLVVAIAAVIAILVVLWFKWDAFREFVKDFWEDLKQAAQDVGEWFANAWEEVKAFFSNWEEWWGRAKEAVQVAWDAIKGFFSDLGSGIAGFFTGVWDDIVSGLSDAGGAIGDFFSDIGGWFADLPGLVGGYAEKAVKLVINAFKQLSWGRIGQAIGFAVGRYIRLVFYDIPQKTAEGLANAVRKFWEWYNNILDVLHDIEWGMINWAGGTMSSFFNTIGGWLSQIPGLFISYMTQAIAWLMTSVPQFASAAWNIGWSIFTNIIELFVKTIPLKIAEYGWQAINWLITHVDDFFKAAWDIGSNIFNGIIDFVSDLPGKVLGFITDAVNIVRNAAGSAFEAAKDFGEGFWNGFRDGIFGSPKTKIEYALMDMDDQADATLAHINRSIRSLNRLGATIPVTMGGASLGMGAGAVTNNYNQHGPLIGEAVIRDDTDIDKLAKRLDERQSARQASIGRRTLVGAVS